MLQKLRYMRQIFQGLDEMHAIDGDRVLVGKDCILRLFDACHAPYPLADNDRSAPYSLSTGARGGDRGRPQARRTSDSRPASRICSSAQSPLRSRDWRQVS